MSEASRTPLGLLRRLKERKLVQWALAYVAGGWVVLQVIDVIAEPWGLSDGMVRALQVVVVVGFFVALVLAWYHGEQGRQRVSAVEVLIIVALLLTSGFLGARFVGSEIASEPRQAGDPFGAGGVPDASVAVLPFVNLSSDPEQEYFSDGLSEELLNHLAQISDLQVAGRTSSFVFKNQQTDLQTIGERLGVANLLEGSVRRSGSQLRISARLVDAREGFERWSGTFDRQLEDVFQIQEEIALEVAEALSVTLSVGFAGRDQLGTSNFDAYEAYLRGQSLYYEAGLSPAALREATAAYQQALELDPDYGRAWIGLVNSRGNLALSVDSLRTQALADLSLAAARLMELAPDAWESSLFRAYQLQSEWDWVGAQSGFDEAARRGPTDPLLWADSYGAFLASVGRVREAAALYQEARDHDPLSMYVSRLVIQYLDYLEDREGVAQEYERSMQLGGPRTFHEYRRLVRLLFEGAPPEEIDAQFARRLALGSGPLFERLSEVWGSPEEARQAVEGTVRSLQSVNASGNVFVGLQDTVALFGGVDLALEVLREAHVARRRAFLGTLWSPQLSQVRADPRFKQIAREIGLVEYWQTTGEWGDFCDPVGDEDFECR